MKTDMDEYAAEYIRVSTPGQAGGNGFRRQEKAIQGIRRDKGLLRFDGYRDVCSGHEEKRPELGRLNEDIENGEINIVVVDDLTRLARNRRLLKKIVKSWLSKGVRLISAKEHLDTATSTSRLVSSLGGYLVELKTSTLAETLNSGSKSYRTGSAPFGLIRNSKTKEFELDPKTFYIVRYIKRLQRKPLKPSKILKKVQAKGYAPAQAEVFGKSSLARILKRDEYDPFLDF